MIIACRDFLRHIDHPTRLEGNRLLRTIYPNALPIAAILPRAHRRLDEALTTLSPRQRCIITRCDQGGELFRAVAIDIGISERQLFRERAKAHEKLVEYLLACGPVSTPAAVVSTNSAELLLATARALEQCGETEQALQALERADSVHEPADRRRIELQAAHLQLCLGEFEGAKHSVARARSIIRDFESNPWADGLIDLTEARVAWEDFRSDQADQLLRLALRKLRRSVATNTDPVVQDALASALCTKSYFDYDHGKFDEAQSAAVEGIALHYRSGSQNATVALDLKLRLGLIRMARGDQEYHAKTLSDCYEEALGRNLIKQALGTQLFLGSMLRRQGHFEKAQEVLGAVLRELRTSAVDLRTETLLEHAMVDGLQGRLSAALQKFSEARPHLNRFPRLRRVGAFMEAKILLAARDFRKALDYAEALSTECKQRSLTKVLAESLEIRARALAGLGNFRDARREASAVADLFEQIGLSYRARQSRMLPLRLGAGIMRTCR